MISEEIENRMVIDSEWGEIEYGLPDKRRLKRHRAAWEELEREERNELIRN